jgi:glycosyltransferase involved in cell wall biosynthesis
MLRDLECNNDYPSKAVVIPNGVNIEEIQSSQCLPLVGDPSFLYVGHLEWHKGVDILLGAFKQLSEREGFHNAHLHLVGSGRMETLARNFVITKNLVERVHFWGTQSQEMVFRLLKGCDILVLPSRHEASPVVLLEAMAAGKPIISTNIGGIPEMLADGRNALLVRPSQGELTKAMQYLKENGDLLKLFSRNNRKDVSLYSWKHVSEKYVKLYRSIADF